MLTSLFWLVIFIMSLAVLIKASDFFTDSAEKIGLAFDIPTFIVGVTIVALGTSLPELITSIVAVFKDSSEIVVGNVVGSNIANIFLIFGITAIAAKKMTITHNIIKVDLPFLVGSAFLIAITGWDGSFNRAEAVLCLAGIASYLLYTVNTREKQENLEKVEEIRGAKKEPSLSWTTWAILFSSAFFIYIGARYTVESIIKLSEILNLGKEVIAVSAVALGTSLPELVVSLTAAKKGNPGIAVGNVLGSNIFNSFAVIGIPALMGTLVVPQSIIAFSLPVMLIATFLFVLITQDKEISQWEGWLLLIFYIFFIGKLFKVF
jgi:cation:H+ antiporter